MIKEKLLYLQTFGCQMNVSDSEKIAGLLKNIGYRPTNDSSLADLIILNTCSVRARAEEKVYNHLVQYKGLKRKRPKILIGVGGCVAQQEGERLLLNIPHLDFVFGTHNLHLLPELVLSAEKGERQAETDFIDNDSRLDLFPVDNSTNGVSRFVTVMQGCDNFCSYCIVPYVRGREISRRSADILEEISQLAAKGVKEVTLLGQNVNSYGLKSDGELDFVTLLRQVSEIPGIERLRFTTSHPKDFSRQLIDCFAEMPKLCKHVHLPAQAGSNAVLSAMNRGYSREEYLSLIGQLKTVSPGIQITGDIIVGFPGETETDFQETLSLLEEVRYTDVFSFIYSKRPETKAAGYTDHISQKEKQMRLDRLLAMQRKITLENNRSFEGSVQEVLVEGESRRGGQIYGRISGNRIVNITADPALVGQMVRVTITRGEQNSLQGELCN
ncbi:tRNA (6-N-dimethylallyladenosine37-C2)-methylthiotransferase [Geotalea daltonii FRC-32]|uniref:tRNA-2-methylthio-N(6)-dimethylallyladenosine synthase n=1 Tax=Geotalea daltonii (strain DSM 22248 / JCM 15807 / FRC-32) TaxID=316067 RepID=B9M9G0_GEODF|nr:tRNA (N6-isopentenyl adenosine(37)-C2)-methylthiotransferase MiaB [Geotalea daltonii]ACM20532.1 tRNA (6-N-dimethylallyladenosine37-C2)-methylthiotransferase [Geotalea daltonii FRC-32]